MKKVSNIPVSSRALLTSRRFKVFVVILLVVMIAMSVILVKMYIDINKEETEENISAKNIITHMNKELEKYTVFEDENGMLGVTGKDDKIIIEPYWKDIYILSENRFVVSRMFGGQKKMGVINRESNILVPFIFEDFKSLSSDFIGGFTGDGEQFFLFDSNGDLLINKVWTEYKYSDGIIYLKDGMNEYRGKSVDGKFQFVYAKLRCSVGYTPFCVTFTESKKIESIGIENIDKIAGITDTYINYLISGDNSIDISDITSEQYFSSLSSNDFFKDCRINKISDFSVNMSEDKSVSYDVNLSVNYDYNKEKSEPINITSEFTFNIIPDENNRLILKSINKTEIK